MQPYIYNNQYYQTRGRSSRTLALFCCSRAPFSSSCWLARTHLKKIAALRVTFSRFAARLGRFGAQTCSPKGPQDASGLDSETRKNCFFEVFVCGKRSTRKTSDIDKTLAGAIRNALRSCRAVVENVHKSIRKRFRLRWAMRRALTGVLGVVPNAFGASPKRPEAAIERFLAALDALGVPQDRLWGGTWGFKGRPRQVWTRS